MKKITFPISTMDEIILDKSFPMSLYLKMTLESKRNPGEEKRYLYKNNFDNAFFAREQSITVRTVQRQLNSLKNHQSNIIKAISTEHGLCYSIDYKVDEGKNYVLINEDIIKQLLELRNDNAVKIYLILLYTLEGKEKMITRDWLLNKMGLSLKSKKTATNCLKILEDAKLIKIKRELNMDEVVDKNGNIVERLKSNNFISIFQPA